MPPWPPPTAGPQTSATIRFLERLLALNLERAAEEAQAQQSPKRKPTQRHKTEHELL